MLAKQGELDEARVANSFGFWPWVAGCRQAGCSLRRRRSRSDPLLCPDHAYVRARHAGGCSAVQLRPVEVAGYLRSRPLIVRRATTRLSPRYAGGRAVEQGIGRVLRKNFGRGSVVPGSLGRDSPAFDTTHRAGAHLWHGGGGGGFPRGLGLT